MTLNYFAIKIQYSLVTVPDVDCTKEANEFFADEFLFKKKWDSGRAKELWLLRSKI